MKEKRRSLRALWIVLALLLGLTISVSAAMLHNDYNGDGKIGSQDALYLLRHIMDPGTYPIHQPGDLDGDGKADQADALYLLRHSLNPEKYPLAIRHTETVISGTPATCTESGLTNGVGCSTCGQVLTEQTVIPALGHSYADGVCSRCGALEGSEGLEYLLTDAGYVVVGLGSCTDSQLVIPDTHQGVPVIGIESGAFQNADHITSVIIGSNVEFIHSFAFVDCDGLQEVYILSENVSFAGSMIFSDCDALDTVYFAGDPIYWEQNGFVSDGDIQLILNYGHQYVGRVLTAPGCTEGGVTEYTCEDCGRSYQQQAQALGHSFTAPQIVPATCHAEGSKTGSCSRCGLTVTEVIPQLEHHIPSYTQEVAPTCSQTGTETGICTLCGTGISRELPVLEHTIGEFTPGEGSCGEHPIGYAQCEICGATVYEVSHNIKTESHLASCTEAGYVKTYCTKCDYEVWENLGIAEHIASDWTVTVPATCISEGSQVKACLGCGQVMERRTLPVTDHILVVTEEEENSTYHCQNCDYSETVETTDKYTITFVSNCDLQLPALYVAEGELPEMPVPTQEGMIFEGWYWDEGCSVPYENSEITKDSTFYALWSQEKITATEGSDNVEMSATKDYEFAVIAPGGLSDGNLSSFVTVTDSKEDSVRIYIRENIGSTYYIRGDYAPGDIYKVEVTGGVTLEETGTEPLWFVVEAPDIHKSEVNRSVFILQESQIFTEYQNGDSFYLVLTEDLLNVGQLVLVVGENSEDYLYAAEIIGEAADGDTYCYQYVIPDMAEIFDEYDVFTKQPLDMNCVVLADDWKETVESSVTNSKLYSDFRQASEQFAIAKEDSKYFYRFSGTSIKICELMIFYSDDIGRNELVFKVELSSSFEKVNKQTLQTEDVANMTLTISVRLHIDVSISLRWIRFGCGRIAYEINNTNTITFTFSTGLQEDEKKEVEFFKKLMSQISSRGSLPEVATDAVDNEELIPLVYVPLPLFAGVTADVTVYNVFDCSLTGQLGIELQKTTTSSACLQFTLWVPDVDFYKQNTLSLDAYLAGKARISEGVRMEVGLNLMRFVRVAVNATVSAYAEVGGFIRFTWPAGQQARLSTAGYLAAGLNVKAMFYGELGFRWTMARFEKQLCDEDIPLFQLGEKNMLVYFEQRDEAYELQMDFDQYVSLPGIVDLIGREQDLGTLIVSSKLQKDCNFALIDPNSVDSHIILTPNGALKVLGCGLEKTTFRVRISKGSVYKDVTIHIVFDHEHIFTETVVSSGCLVDLVHNYQCQNCSYSYNVTISPAPGHSFGDWEILEPTCENNGYQRRSCTACGFVEQEIFPALQHDFSLQIVDEQYLHSQATCISLAQYQFVCSKCMAGSPKDFYEYGEFAPHVYLDPYTCHERPCQTPRCTHTDPAVTPHPFTEWFEAPAGGCNADGYSVRACQDCGYCETDLEGDVIHAHQWAVEPALMPTCTEAGYQDHIVCQKCGVEANKTIVPALGHLLIFSDITEETHREVCHRPGCDYQSTPVSHIFENRVVVVEPGCMTAGLEHIICFCGYETDVPTPPKGHRLISYDEKEPTCTQAGYAAYEECSICDYTTYQGELKPLGHLFDGSQLGHNSTSHWVICARVHCDAKNQEQPHSFSLWIISKEPTCEGNGMQERSCAACAYTEHDTIPALGHTYVDADWQKNDTEHWKVCQRCHAPSPKQTHTPGAWSIETEATCTEYGLSVTSCTACGHPLEKADPEPLGHDVNGADWIYDETNHWIACLRCGENLHFARHSFGAWITETEPACETEGLKYRLCSQCSCRQEENQDALGHSYDGAAWENNDTVHWQICIRDNCGKASQPTAHIFGSWNTELPADCVNSGLEVRICNTCHFRQEHTLDPLGHDYTGALWETDARHHWKTCIRKGCEETSSPETHNQGPWVIDQEPGCETPGAKHWACDQCGYKETAVIEATGHDRSGAWQYTGSSEHYRICKKCSHKIDMEAHKPEKGDTVAPTCLEGGYTEYVCFCGYSTRRDLTDALNHLYSQWQYNDSYHWRTCLRNGCDYTSELMEHRFADWTEVYPPTCTTEGMATSHCTVCQYEGHKSIDPLGHNHTGPLQYTDSSGHYRICGRCEEMLDQEAHTLTFRQKIPVTCTEDGYSIYTCSCQYNENRDFVTHLGHNYVEHGGKSSTCEEPGWFPYLTCTRCDLNTREEIPATGHDFDRETWHFDDTSHYHICTHCGKKETLISHALNTEVTESASCTNSGIKRTYCLICDFESFSPINPDPDHDHSGALQYDDSAGHYRICGVCGERIDVQNHSYIEKITAAACESQGYTEYRCICGYSYQDHFTPATGHQYDAQWSVDEATGEHYYVCLNGCGIDKDRGSHTYGAWETSVEATCTQEGEQVRKCILCQHIHSQKQVIPMLPHDTYQGLTTQVQPGAGETLYIHTISVLCRNCDYCEPSDQVIVHQHNQPKPLSGVTPTCTEAGLTSGIACGVAGCEEVFLAQEEIPALGHDFVDGYCTRCGEAEEPEPTEPVNNVTFSMVADQKILFRGDTLTLTISCVSNLEATSYGLKLNYDTNLFTYVSGQCAVPGAMFNNASKNGVVFMFSKPTAYSGVVGTITLKVQDNASLGKYDIVGVASVKNSVQICDSVGCTISVEITQPLPTSKGLAYTLSSDGTYYIVSGIGTCTDTDLVIPSTHDGKPVREIGEEVFQVRVVSVIIPDSVTHICENTFSRCSDLQYTVYDHGLYLGNEKNPYFALISVDSPFITSCELHPDTALIADQAFYHCSELTSIVIPDKVTVIGKNAFPGDSSLTTVYYTGTAEQWCQMDTSDLIDVYYYLQPGDCYWYYVDGVPTVKNQEGGKSL